MKIDRFLPEIRISGWKHLDFGSVDFVDLKLRSPFGGRIKLSPETLFQRVSGHRQGRQLYVLIRKGRFRMRTS
ncbi:MAG: hypothetical protein C0407_12350 [Desulfobacca sp.]|nr:hypothetical protein [Desulfobacca sp.]